MRLGSGAHEGPFSFVSHFKEGPGSRSSFSRSWPEVAGLWAGSYWATFTAGRFAAGLYARRTGVERMVRGSLLAALLALHALAAGKNPDGRNAALPGDATQSYSREQL